VINTQHRRGGGKAAFLGTVVPKLRSQGRGVAISLEKTVHMSCFLKRNRTVNVDRIEEKGGQVKGGRLGQASNDTRTSYGEGDIKDQALAAGKVQAAQNTEEEEEEARKAEDNPLAVGIPGQRRLTIPRVPKT
jgi:hypothetical protein